VSAGAALRNPIVGGYLSGAHRPHAWSQNLPHACCWVEQWVGVSGSVRSRVLQVDGVRWHATLQGAWWGPTASRDRLHQVSSRRHKLLRGAWWGPTLSKGGLYQVSCERHGLLHSTWWGTTVSRSGPLLDTDLKRTVPRQLEALRATARRTAADKAAVTTRANA